MAGRVMRAIRVSQFGGPEVLKLTGNVPIPKPEEQQVLIKVNCAGVNPAETYIRAGSYAKLPSLPYTPGSDLAGVVEYVGSKVKKFKPGDRVFTFRGTGAYAEYALAPESFTFLLSERLSFKQGAALGVPYFTAYKALVLRGGVKPGETVLIHGASGAVGLAACQIARALGNHVIGTAGSDKGMTLAQQCGAHKTYNHRKDDYMSRIKDDYPNGVDVLVEMLADANLEKDMVVMGHRGRVLVVGSRGSLEFTPRSTMAKEIDVRGVMLGSATQAEFDIISAALLAGIETGWAKPEVGHEFPLEDAARAHVEVIEHSAGTTGRIVLNVC